MLFPHKTQTEGLPEHTQLDSIAQDASHPSPGVVFPSSHASVPPTVLSPQTDQLLGAPEQV